MTAGYDAYFRQLEQQKGVTPGGVEFWRARDIQAMLGYDRWVNFEAAIQRARAACASAGVRPENHFLETAKKVPLGSGAVRPVSDYFLTRYACYLIAMNAEPSKPEVGFAQTYFAMQTRQQELQDQKALTADRIAMRDRLRDANKDLARAARAAGVKRFGIFQDEGYKGLYGGRGLKQIKVKKGLIPKEDLIDRMGRTELAANAFRATQADEQIRTRNIAGEENAFKEHHRVGKEVREAIRRVGGRSRARAVPEEARRRGEEGAQGPAPEGVDRGLGQRGTLLAGPLFPALRASFQTALCFDTGGPSRRGER